MFSVTDIT